MAECIAIVAYEVLHEDRQRFLDSWERANAILKAQPGFVSTALHQAVSANPDFRFVNVSTWETDDAFRAATQDPGFQTAAGRLNPYPIHAAAYEVIRS